MSEDHLTEETITRDDERLLELIDGLDPERAAPVDRVWLETLGLLPYELEEIEARPEIKRRLIARLSTGASPAAAPEPPHSTSGRLVALERRARWYAPIAAVLAIALLGVAAFQFRQLAEQRRTIAELSAQLERVELGGAEVASIRDRLDEQDDHLRMMTSRGAEFCLLRPVGQPPRYPGATATMVISPERNRWYLVVEGLEACPASGCYELWFVADGERIHAASFDASGGDGRVELSGRHKGLPVTVRAVTITRDEESESERPAETVLLADEAMTLL